MEQEISRGGKHLVVKEEDLIDIPVQEVNGCLMDDNDGGGDNNKEKEEENNFGGSYVSGILLNALVMFSHLLNEETKYLKGKQLSQDQSVKLKIKLRFPDFQYKSTPHYIIVTI